MIPSITATQEGTLGVYASGLRVTIVAPLCCTLVDVDTDLPVARVPCITEAGVSSCVARTHGVLATTSMSALSQRIIDIIADDTIAHVARVASATE